MAYMLMAVHAHQNQDLGYCMVGDHKHTEDPRVAQRCLEMKGGNSYGSNLSFSGHTFPYFKALNFEKATVDALVNQLDAQVAAEAAAQKSSKPVEKVAVPIVPEVPATPDAPPPPVVAEAPTEVPAEKVAVAVGDSDKAKTAGKK